MANAQTNGASKRKRAKRPKQETLPGMARKKDKAIAKLADSLYDIQMERMDLQTQEAEMREKLLAAMRKKKLEVYEDRELELRVTLKLGIDKVSVKRLAADD